MINTKYLKLFVYILVECAIANIELTSTIDAINFESKIKKVEQMIENFAHKEDEEQMDEDSIKNT